MIAFTSPSVETSFAEIKLKPDTSPYFSNIECVIFNPPIKRGTSPQSITIQDHEGELFWFWSSEIGIVFSISEK